MFKYRKNIKDINELNEIINKSNSNKDLEIKISPKEDEINTFLDSIKKFGEIYHIDNKEQKNNNMNINIPMDIFIKSNNSNKNKKVSKKEKRKNKEEDK